MINNLEPQVCFIGASGEMFCNYVVRQGRVIRPKNSKFLKFWPKFRKVAKTEIKKTLVRRENEQVSSQLI